MFENNDLSPPNDLPIQNVILVATGADESWLTAFSDTVKLSSKEVFFVGLHQSDPPMEYDYLFSDIDAAGDPELLVIPQGEACMKQLLVDPRVHLLINKIVAKGGVVAFGKGAELMMSQIPVPLRADANHLRFQRNMETPEFAKQLLVLS
ncbi:MAG: hypothetical protein AAGD96_16570 [Chloroflexota bacterium]